MAVIINSVIKGSLADHLNLKANDCLVKINNKEINDILDYLFYTTNESLILEVVTSKNEVKQYNVSKEEHTDLGLVFNDFLMDSERGCHNRCIFCFVDQNPPGMRSSIYQKDDDERLSFLFGNYLTLTNLNETQITRLIDMNISPINISIHTTNPDLLVSMLNNTEAAKTPSKIRKLAEAEIKLNCQIVLCKGINDKHALESTLTDLISLYPSVQSISVVPVGLTEHRKNLHKLESYSRDDAKEVLDTIVSFHNRCRQEYGIGLVYASDEWYIKTGRATPSLDYYDEMYQIENGVGMLALFESEFNEALDGFSEATKQNLDMLSVDIVTGDIAYVWMKELLGKATTKLPNLNYRVHLIKNEFYGGNVGVTGLLTARDVMEQLKKEEVLGNRILIPRSMFRSEGDLTLDNLSLDDMIDYYEKDVVVVSSGYDLFDAFTTGSK